MIPCDRNQPKSRKQNPKQVQIAVTRECSQAKGCNPKGKHGKKLAKSWAGNQKPEDRRIRSGIGSNLVPVTHPGPSYRHPSPTGSLRQICRDKKY